MAAEIDEDVEAFRRRLDTIVRDAYSEQHQGVGIIEEIVEFEPFVFDIDVGEPFIVFKGPSRPSAGACCFNDINPDNPCIMYPSQGACEGDGGIWKGGSCADDPCDVWACCYDDVCLMQIEADCGGDFKLGQSCSETDICPTGACCFEGSCFEGYSQFDCETISAGLYQGDGTVCSPNPCPNACCLPDDGGCVDESEDDCTIAGGTYRSGQSCGVCGCTDASACNYNVAATIDDGSCAYVPGATVVCDISFASKSKCGYSDGGDPPHYFLQQDVMSVWSFSAFFGHYLCDDHTSYVDWTWYIYAVAHTINTYDRASCILTEGVCLMDGGSAIYVTRIDGDPSCGTNHPECVTHTIPISTCGQITCDQFTCNYLGDPCGRFIFTFPTESISLTNEYTTAELIADVEGALPPFPGTFEEGGCASSRFLSTDEVTYSEQTCQYKIVIPDTAIPITITWNEHFDGGGDTPRSATLPAHTTETGVYFLAAPSSNGTITITDVVVTC